MDGKIELGDRVRDRISGYQGLVICISDWIFGCRRPLVQGEGLTSDGKPVELQSFDEPSLELLEKGVLKPVRPQAATVTQPKTGGPQVTPLRQPDPSRGR